MIKKTDQSPYNYKQTLIFGVGFLFSLPSFSNEKPNIIIIYADDLGYGDLSSYGGDIPTPNIDRIGKEGIQFTNFYVSAPASTPSRYSLLTGAYPQRSKHGLTKALMPANENKIYLDESEATIAEYLKDNGYLTSLFGKWHLGAKNSDDGPLKHGFDKFAGFMGGCIDFFTHVYGKMGHDWYINNQQAIEKGYSTDLITNHAINFIDKANKNNEPFFTFISYNAPHYGKADPDNIIEHTVELNRGKYLGFDIANVLQAPTEYIKRFEHISDPYRQAYSAMVACMDDNIGKILDKLQQEKLLNNTIIWFISDNGGYSEKYFGHADNGDLRGEKGTLWEGGIKIPSLLLWKGKIESGKIINNTLCNIDVLPTLLSILNIQIPDTSKFCIDGIDISPIIFQNKHINRSLFWKYMSSSAIRSGDWKLLDDSLLFNLNKDPYESTDLSTKYPEKVNQLKLEYQQIREDILSN